MCDCSCLAGRRLDLCTGEGHDGRPAPSQAAVDQWRAKHCHISPNPTVQQPLPPLWKRAWNFVSASMQHVAAGRPKCSEQQIQDRLAICETCELFDGKHCTECGCACNGTAQFMNKIAWADQECPHPAGAKWGRVG